MGKSKKELRKEILEWINEQDWENKVFLSIPIQKFVKFSKRGLRHTISRNYNYPEVEIQLTKKVMKILPNSFYMGFSYNKDKKKEHIKGIHNYYDIVMFRGELYEVWFKVRETKDSLYFYDHGIIKKL